MKNAILLLLAIVQVNLMAQDVIYFNNGTQQLTKVIEINQTEVIYKKASNPDGPQYRVNKSDISSIAYENGGRDLFNSTSANTSSVVTPATVTQVTPPPQQNTVVQYYPAPAPRPNVVVQLGAPVYVPPVVFGGTFGYGNYYGGYAYPSRGPWNHHHGYRPRCHW